MVTVHARPGASRSRIAGVHGEALKVQLHARPVEGAANRELVAVLADALAVRPSAVSIESGAAGREKRVRIEGLDLDAALRRLAPFVDNDGAPD